MPPRGGGVINLAMPGSQGFVKTKHTGRHTQERPEMNFVSVFSDFYRSVDYKIFSTAHNLGNEPMTQSV